jgi:hypothetical protein
MRERERTLTRRHRRDELVAAMQHPQREKRRGAQSKARPPHRRSFNDDDLTRHFAKKSLC